MNNKKTIRNILIGLGIAIAGLGVYSMISSSDLPDTSGAKTGLSSLLDSSVLGQIKETDAKTENAKILKVLGGIQNIVLKDDIFSNPVFKKLKDSNFSIPNPVVVGRPNPFLPIGFESFLGGGSDYSENELTDEERFNNDFFGTLDIGGGVTLDGSQLSAVNQGGQN